MGLIFASSFKYLKLSKLDQVKKKKKKKKGCRVTKQVLLRNILVNLTVYPNIKKKKKTLDIARTFHLSKEKKVFPKDLVPQLIENSGSLTSGAKQIKGNVWPIGPDLLDFLARWTSHFHESLMNRDFMYGFRVKYYVIGFIKWMPGRYFT